MTRLIATIPGQPVGKGRPRLGKYSVYTPERTEDWEALARHLFRQRWGGRPPLQGPAMLHVNAVSRRPKKLYRKKDRDGRIWRLTKPDADNVLKAVADALVQARVVRDDTRIVRWLANSLYAAKDAEPCVEVLVHPIPIPYSEAVF